MTRLSHLGPGGAARMVDVGSKPPTRRVARAEAELRMKAGTARALREGRGPKGDVFQVARLAGIQGAKRCSDLIPLCHPVALTSVAVDFRWEGAGELRIETRAEAVDRTGVEMEALAAAAASALTVYDMAKALDRGMEIRRIRLLEKSGGKSGHFMREEKRKRKR